MVKRLNKKAIFFSAGLLATTIAPLAHSAGAQSQPSWLVPTSILNKVPTDKATVGIIPYYIQDEQVYVFLGRERIDSGKDKAGKFSDFGGSTEKGESFANNAKREFNEETMGTISISEQDLIDKGSILHKISDKKRDIIYIFYPMSPHEYAMTKNLNLLWPKLCADKQDSVTCEKDQFAWFNADDIADTAEKVRNIDGGYSTIQLREFFVQDCIKHPDFSKLLKHISPTAPSSSLKH